MTGLKIDRAALNAHLQKVLEPHGEAGKAFLQEALTGPGSGIWWKEYGNPNRSSAPGEYPAEQEGNLKDAVDARPGDHPLEVKIGFFADKNEQGFQEAVELHERPPSQGGRPALEIAWGDRSFRKALLDGGFEW